MDCWLMAKDENRLLLPGQGPRQVAGGPWPRTKIDCWLIAKIQTGFMAPGRKPVTHIQRPTDIFLTLGYVFPEFKRYCSIGVVGFWPGTIDPAWSLSTKTRFHLGPWPRSIHPLWPLARNKSTVTPGREPAMSWPLSQNQPHVLVPG